MKCTLPFVVDEAGKPLAFEPSATLEAVIAYEDAEAALAERRNAALPTRNLGELTRIKEDWHRLQATFLAGVLQQSRADGKPLPAVTLDFKQVRTGFLVVWANLHDLEAGPLGQPGAAPAPSSLQG